MVPRVCGPQRAGRQRLGQVEIESLEDGREGMILENLVKSAVLTVFKELVPFQTVAEVLPTFEEGAIVHTGDDVPSADLARLVDDVPTPLKSTVARLTGGDESPAALAAAVEFVLEGSAPVQATEQGHHLRLGRRHLPAAAEPSALGRQLPGCSSWNTAPCGSEEITANWPMPSIGVGGMMTPAPKLVAFATVPAMSSV